MDSIAYKKLVSNTISNIRFPLMIGVIFSHCNIGREHAYSECVKLFAHFTSEQILLSGIVPLFFMTSGFLFFWNIKDFNIDTYISKLRSRTNNILKPYLLWNTFMIFCYATLHIFIPSFISPENENVLQYSIVDWISAYWDKSGGYPVNYALWFLRNLYIIVIFSPIIFFFLNRPYFREAFLFVVIFFSFFWAGHGLLGLVYFYIGALLSRGEMEARIIDFSNSAKARPICICILSLVIFVWIYASLSILLNKASMLLMSINRISSVCIVIAISIYITHKKGAVNLTVSDSGYFMYLFHAFPLFCVRAITFRMFNPTSLLEFIFVYFLQILIISCLCIGTYMCLMKYFPAFTSWTIGRPYRK